MDKFAEQFEIFFGRSEMWWVAFNKVEIKSGKEGKGRAICVRKTREELFEATKAMNRPLIFEEVKELTPQMQVLA